MKSTESGSFVSHIEERKGLLFLENCEGKRLLSLGYKQVVDSNELSEETSERLEIIYYILSNKASFS
jgi:hypothetical protein